MGEPFKHLLGPAVVHGAATHLRRVWPGFDAPRFEALALTGLDALELKARVGHIASALEATLPDDFDAAARVIEASLAPPHDDDAISGPGITAQGLAGWVIWPLGDYVARRGLAQPERALRCLHALTQRSTAEFAIRPFIVAHPRLVFDTLARWTRDPSAHVRRLVSEGSRPRLPWGLRLHELVRDPGPTLPLLEALQDDPSEYVRRSVANHLNDIAKDHPQRVADWIERHLPDAGPDRRALLRHASRSLIKHGDARMLALWGLGQAFKGTVGWRLSPARVALGDAVQLELHLAATGRQAQSLEIDYRVHHVKANGTTSPKTFKGWRLVLAPGETVLLRKSHSMKPVTTRRYFAGRHVVEVQINGRVVADAAFTLRVPRA